MVNDNANIKFQLDCGATCNLLPLKDYARVMGDPDDLYIEKSKAKLTMYNGAVMYPVGKCKLKCTREGSSHVLKFQVVDEDVRPLLSAESCQKVEFLESSGERPSPSCGYSNSRQPVYAINVENSHW